MLKVLAILALVALLLPMYGQEKTSLQQKDEGESASTSGTTVNVVNQQSAAPDQSATRKQPQSYLETLVSANSLPTLGLVIVGALGIWLAWKTVIATEKSAAAALLNAQNLANSERARIAFAGQPIGHSVKLSAKNVGRVVAGITYARGFTEALPYGQTLPKVPKYLDGHTYTEVDEWVSPGDFANIPHENGGYYLLIDLSDPSLRDAIRDKTTAFWTYARICYRDGISPDVRETRFCFSVSIREDGYPAFRIERPAGYNYST